ncbi:MAG TPA: hypothetical protein VFS05_12650 [Gemmatimonadaceae bacterium]|nr:hypothetical protein [Gemmatimonadaceae bacterium]
MHTLRSARLAACTALALAGAVSVASAQSAPQGTRPAAAVPTSDSARVVPARPADVASIDAIITALYDVISGPAGQARDWDRFRSLFHPAARLIPSGQRPGGGYGARAMDPEGYITRAGPMLEKNGFFEREIGRSEQRFGNIVQLLSAYESRHTAADAKPFARGVNSIQLLYDGTRWWVMTIFWAEERPDLPLPPELLRPAGGR